jgi:OOP family OmpA-OmpF porin
MKKISLSLLAIGAVVACFGQNENKKRPALGIHFVLNDFKTAADIRTSGLSTVLKSKEWHKTQNMVSGLAVSYIQGVSDHVDFAGTLAGSFLDYPVPNKVSTNKNSFLLEATATANLKLMTDNYWFNPFLTAGVGAAKWRGYYSGMIPVGVGIQVSIWQEAYILLNSQYRIPITENGAYHFYHSIGIAGSLKKKPEPVVVLPPPPPPPPDRDGDGVLDADDACPDVFGLASLKGCPDRDGDGIADNDDKCPDVKGLARYQGCPIPDTDKDGINDEEDKCPTVPGVARYQGCPIPDTDKDGVNDEEDKCINEPGPASNYGCPVIKEEVIQRVNAAAKNIFFATGSSKLLAKSFKSLNDVVAALNENPTYNVQIDGHTDNTGADTMNLRLSNDRAASVKNYLVSKGIADSRLNSTGYGETTPVADNKTAAGRARNRRVEMTLKNY